MSPVDRAGLEARMREQGLDPTAWSNGPAERYDQHAHDYDKVLVAAEGSITFGLVGYGVGILISAGERLDMPAGVEHDAVVGPRGVVCLEAHLAAGTLGSRARGRGYRW